MCVRSRVFRLLFLIAPVLAGLPGLEVSYGGNFACCGPDIGMDRIGV